MTPTADLPATRAGFVTIDARPLPRMGYGTMGLAATVAAGRRSLEAGVALLQHALELGVQAYDTADFYSNDTANRLLAAAFADRRADVCYLTKVGAREPEAHSAQSLVIAGTTSHAHLDENVAAAGLRLPDDVLQALDAVRG